VRLCRTGLVFLLSATPLRAQVPAVTLGRGPFNGLKARVVAIRFFESAGNVPDRKTRVVTTTFDALTTRFINLELELEYAKAAKRTEFEVQCRFEGPDGKLRTPLIHGAIDPGWVASYHTAGWGSQDRGQWPEWSYQVSCLEEGQVVVAAGFTVVKNAPAVRNLGASMTHLRFFQSLAERLPLETRQYGTRFDARTAGWIKVEFGLVYPQVAAPVNFIVECVYVFPDKTIHPVKVERQVPSGWTGSVHTQGIGWSAPGHWPVGVYQVSCWNNGEKMGAGSFEMFDGGAPLAAAPGSRLRFYGRKSGDAAPPAYASTFDAGAADTLYAEAVMPVRSAGDSTTFACVATDPAGVTAGFPIKGELREKDPVIAGAGRVGQLDAPRLRGGYRVECRIGPRGVVADGFEVTGKPDLPELDARFLTSAIYEGGDDPPGDEAVSDVSFRAPQVRSFWLAALFDHPTDPAAAALNFSCRITGARNAVLADSGPQSFPVAQGSRAISFIRRIPLLPRQKWAPGHYALACVSGGVAFIRTGLDLTR
jgi:hypothetical protein